MDTSIYALGILVVMTTLYICLVCVITDLKTTIKKQHQQIIELLQNKE